MRILSGKYRSRIIQMPKGIRPTQDKVRKALFDILGDVEGLSFLELFAGSGAIGLEALSQGAKEVVFAEREKRCCKIIQQNLRYVSQFNRQTILNMDSMQAIILLFHKKQKFDIIFLDPPYYAGLSKKTLQTLSAYDILAPNGLVVVQHFKKDNLTHRVGELILFKQARYADTFLSFYRKNIDSLAS